MRAILLTVALGTLVGPVLGQAKKERTPAPVPAQTWSCLFAGGLIDGSCQGVTAEDLVVVRRNDGVLVEVPLELFEAGQQEQIRKHFGVAAKEPVKTDAVRGGHPWHSSRAA